MELDMQKRIAADILKVGAKKVAFDPARLKDVKDAITRADIRSLIKDGAINKRPSKEKSRSGARKIMTQKRKGRRKGQGSRKGKASARLRPKTAWINTIRTQRRYLKALKGRKEIAPQIFRSLYSKSKGGFFRSRRHIELYIEEHNLLHKREGDKAKR